MLGLSSAAGKEIVARLESGRLSSDGGLLVLREIAPVRGGRASGRRIADRRNPAARVRR
jgi:hypothetical protein